MTFNEYQNQSKTTALYHEGCQSEREIWCYLALGLTGEAGEVAEKIKKVIRDKDGVLDDEKKIQLKKELGDVLWYISQWATELRVPLSEIAKTNLEKLFSRKERGVIHGEGDER